MSARRIRPSRKDQQESGGRREYRALVCASLPHVIRNRSENEHYTRLLESLDSKPNPTPAEKELAVLKGKRHLTVEHIRRLSERFRVTPELFI
jgi:hypothetical protein